MKNKRKILIITIGIVLITSVALILLNNLGILKKLKASVIDANTGLTCTDCEFASDEIEYEKSYGYYPQEEGSGSSSGYESFNDTNVSEIISHLSTMSNSYCKNGYKCEGKQDTNTTNNNSTICTSASAEQISDSSQLNFSELTLEQLEDLNTSPETLEDALENYYKVYNSDYYCPQKKCVPEIYEINLDPNGGTGGTTKIYEKFGFSYYLDPEATQEMGKNQNPITIPTKNYSITYDDNGQGATFTPGPATINAPFAGYFATADTTNNIFNSLTYDYTDFGSLYNYEHIISGPYGGYDILTGINQYYNGKLYTYWADDEAYSHDSIHTTSSFNASLVDINGYLNIYGNWYEGDELVRGAGLPSTYYYGDGSWPDAWLYYYYEDNGLPGQNGEINPDINEYYGIELSNTIYAAYDLGRLTLPVITKEDYTCFWDNEEYGLNYHPSGGTALINDDTTLNAVCIPNNKITTIVYTCDYDGSNCEEYNRDEESYGYDRYNEERSVSAYAPSQYDCENSVSVTLDNNYTVKFYCTKKIEKHGSMPSTNFDSSLSYYVDSSNTSIDLSTYNQYTDYIHHYYQCPEGSENCESYDYYEDTDQYYDFRIWPAGQDGRGENNILKIPSGSTFTYSYFDNNSLEGYDATYRGKYGIYFINEDSDNWEEPLELRPYIRIIYKVNGEVYATDVKEANSSYTIRTAPTISGKEFKVWQAYAQTSNSIGMNGTTSTSYTACINDNYREYDSDTGYYNGLVYFNSNDYIPQSEWNYSNTSFPCPTYDAYVDNIITVYLEAIYKKDPWYTIE